MIPLSRLKIRPTPEERARFQASYRRRRTLWIASVASTTIWTVTTFFILLLTFSDASDGPVWPLVVLVVLWPLSAVVALGWRCPRCREHFGRSFSVPTCPHCFIELE